MKADANQLHRGCFFLIPRLCAWMRVQK